MKTPNAATRIQRNASEIALVVVLLAAAKCSAGDSARLYWTTFTAPATSKIQRSNLDGSGIEDLVTGLDAPWAIEIDPLRRKLYFGDVGRNRIRRANLDGTNVETVPVGITINVPAGLALDVVNNDLYWSDFRFDRIARTNLDTNTTTVLVGTGLTNPFGLALDLAGGKLYWADTGIGQPGKIQRSNLDGTNIEDLVTGLSNPRDVAIDFAGGRMYWPDLSESAIYRANLDGFDAGVWLSGVSGSHSVAIEPSSRRLYWTSNAGISSRHLDGTGHIVEIVQPAGQYGIAIVVPEPGTFAIVSVLTACALGTKVRRQPPLSALPGLTWSFPLSSKTSETQSCFTQTSSSAH